MVIGLSPLRNTRGFIQPLTSGSPEISQSVHADPSNHGYQKKKKKWLCFVDVRRPHKHVDG